MSIALLRSIRILVLSVLLTTPLSALDYSLEFQGGGGFRGNLYSDSTNKLGSYSNLSLQFKTYPTDALEIQIRTAQTYYPEIIGLSNVIGGLQLTYIPTANDSRFTLLFSGNITGTGYYTGFRRFDNIVADLKATAGFVVTDATRIRGGVTFISTNYTNREDVNLDWNAIITESTWPGGLTDFSVSRQDIEFFIGFNQKLPLRNALDIESGLATTSFLYKHPAVDGFGTPPGYDFPIPLYAWPIDAVPNLRENVWVWFISPRLSRPIGPRTGASVIYTLRNFQNYDQQIVYGDSARFLAPWSNLWDGESITLEIKTYLVPQSIISIGIGYWDKTFIKTIEPDDERLFEAAFDDRRRDWQTRYFISIQRPILGHNGILLEPAIDIEYTKNRSNREFYRYSDFSAALRLRLRL